MALFLRTAATTAFDLVLLIRTAWTTEFGLWRDRMAQRTWDLLCKAGYWRTCNLGAWYITDKYDLRDDTRTTLDLDLLGDVSGDV